MKYSLILNEKQARTISLALDFYSRISGGQFEEILNRFNWPISGDQRHKALESFTNLKCQLTGINAKQPNVGLGNICESGKIAYDLHQVIRHQIAIDNNSGSLDIDLDQPRQVGNEEMAIINKFKG